MAVVQSPQITRLLADPSPRRVADLWARVVETGAPLIEPYDDANRLVTFLWRGEATSTRAWWGVDIPLDRIPGTDLWWATRVLPSDLRTVYCLLHDGVEGLPRDTSGHGPVHVDAVNLKRFLFPADPSDPSDHDHWASVLELPDAPAEPWISPRPGVTTGSSATATLPGGPLGGSREIAVHRPAGVDTDGLPVLVLFDGFLARTVQRVPATLDNLIAYGLIPPLIAVFVGSRDAERDEELSPGPAMAGFVTGQLMPWLRTELGAGAEPGGNIIGGVSRGGLTAAHIALGAPDCFGAVISQSGSFWWPSPDEGEPGWMMREVARRPRADVRFALDVGTGETLPGPGGAPDQLTVNRAMRDALRTRGYHVSYAEFTGGHDYLSWRRTFADALIAVSRVPTA
ncbi:alpha/beta hydrolase-fold protein [Actinoplanes sp. NPDC049596]|uniref:alpha/beta hydrolase-fold protein n=1 Tax=unclassified Actinoplanes TaxID=2626549 RepID=UPI00341D28FC